MRFNGKFMSLFKIIKSSLVSIISLKEIKASLKILITSSFDFK